MVESCFGWLLVTLDVKYGVRDFEKTFTEQTEVKKNLNSSDTK